MPNVYKPQLLQIRPQYSVETDAPDKPENILWFLSGSAGTPTSSQLESIANIFDPLWAEVWQTIAGEVANYTGSIVTDWSSNTGLSYSSVGTYAPVSGSNGALLPPQVAVLISKQIGLRYKGGHPRTYLPYVGSTAVSGVYKDTVVTSNATALHTAYENMLSLMFSSGVLGGQQENAYLFKTNTLKAQTHQLTAVTVDPIIATQRRRVRKVSHR